ncbi:epoxide hydrolase 2 [Pyrenophora seminiperda CCB06]|uniref:Epoxide hydrolase 2 n=1 Tax=Pyrenophora seminiperda CCB06 TaxID=1302712 RepID=A0A3M7MCA0_9PLEO|nr:epoxide hydrolase 2 [Pyrenophora seminiperda CCB06]
MDFLTAGDIKHKNGETTHYYEGGSKEGTPIIFLHGWPDLAESWKHQLSHFAAGNKYRVIAADMRGYGGSSAPKTKESYSLQTLVSEMVEFAEQLGIQKAIWVAHDWGCGLGNALAVHHPELFIGLANLCVPYRCIELGFDFMVSTVNRDIYPEKEYKYGQWEYLHHYMQQPEESVKVFETNVEGITKVFYLKSDPKTYGKPAPTSTIVKDGGWFGGHPENLPDIPLAITSLDEHLYNSLVASKKKNGWFGPVAWYLNHDANAEYAKSEKNGGVLEFPVLYIDAKYDVICSAGLAPKLAESQKKATKNLSVETIEASHWVQLEKPKETNEALEKWMSTF